MISRPYSTHDVEKLLTEWQRLGARKEDVILADWMQQAGLPGHPAYTAITAIFGNSPYLSQLLLSYPEILHQALLRDANAVHHTIAASLDIAQDDQRSLMRHLRQCKNKLALLVAIADMMDWWSLEQVTRALSDFAEHVLIQVMHFLLSEAAKRGEITVPERGSGIVVLGMGKLGGRELNYSSDIDLIILFEAGKLNYQGRHNEQHFMNKLAHDLVHIMQERTADGYIFRTDLRLRPDPASTPPAVNIEAAYYYYESVGQNWERAAMIKARPVAGDMKAGERFLKNIAPFMWRRSLDFASIQDIHSIKRQMDSRQSKDIKIPGHNVKLGIGGIREIEFYAQIHQLIWGGREISLRSRGTCETLTKLAQLGLIDEHKRDVMTAAYIFYRQLEHRLQMVADEQTHDMPESAEAIKHIACFMGYDDVNNFDRNFLAHLHAVHEIYASSFRSSEKLGDEGNLVFTGVSHDPDTLETLRKMGYDDPETVSQVVMGWHHGSRRATRTKRARELLTELMPILLKRLSETASPDAAFHKFNDFLCNLPAGVQIFSLFSMNPQLLGLVADIMGSAPTLAEYLSKSPNLLDSVLYSDFYESLPQKAQLHQQWRSIIGTTQDFEECMDRLRAFRNEKQFQAGVQLLRGMIDAKQSGCFLSDLADLMVEESLACVNNEFKRSYGTMPGGQFAVVALGKLGSRETTFGSDIDLVMVYDAKENASSTGEKPLTASVYYNRLAQRLLNALTAMGRDGRLYEVDTRLRPSQGLLATSLQGLQHYFGESAWTFEYMAFVKARIIAADLKLAKTLEEFIQSQLIKPRDQEKLRQDVIDMRGRIDKEFGTDDIWNIKYVRGGLIDMDFIAQYLILNHAPALKRVHRGSAADCIRWLCDQGVLNKNTATDLLDCEKTLTQLFTMLRLCSGHTLDENTALPGLKRILYQSLHTADFPSLKEKLASLEKRMLSHYNNILN
jgi:glutamate-ammonia-ligase adenylyltransferase